MMRLCGSPNQQRKKPFDDANVITKRGTLQKRRQEVLVFNTTGVLQGEDKQKYTTTKEVPGLIYKQPLKQL